MRKNKWLLLLILALASCSSSSEDNTVHAKSMIEAFESGSIWCTGYDIASKTCTSVQTAERFTQNGVIIKIMTAEPYAVKSSYQTELTRKGNKLCRSDPEDRVFATLNAYRTTNATAKITPDDKSFKFSTIEADRELFEAFRTTLSKDHNLEGAKGTCWEYQMAGTTTKGLRNQLNIVTHIDGVRQAFNQTQDRGNFFPAGTALDLRAD